MYKIVFIECLNGSFCIFCIWKILSLRYIFENFDNDDFYFFLVIFSPYLDPMVDISLSVNEMYNLTSPGYPSNYDINLNLQWTVLALSDYRVMISVTDFRSEATYDYLHIGGGLTFDPDTLMVRFSGTYDSPTEVLLPGREAWILFFSDYSTTNVGFVLEITTSSEAGGVKKAISL